MVRDIDTDQPFFHLLGGNRQVGRINDFIQRRCQSVVKLEMELFKLFVAKVFGRSFFSNNCSVLVK